MQSAAEKAELWAGAAVLAVAAGFLFWSTDLGRPLRDGYELRAAFPNVDGIEVGTDAGHQQADAVRQRGEQVQHALAPVDPAVEEQHGRVLQVAERAGSIALQTHQRVAGVIENMSWLELPDGSRQEIFGSGGGQKVADSLTISIGAPVALLGQIPLDTRLREGGDSGTPVVLGAPDTAAAVALRGIAKGLAARARGLAGRPLGLSPAGR